MGNTISAGYIFFYFKGLIILKSHDQAYLFWSSNIVHYKYLGAFQWEHFQQFPGHNTSSLLFFWGYW
jgi:hypothetical protein